MADKPTPTLNPKIAEIEKGSMVDQLYTAFVDMTNRANNVAAPDFSSNPPMKVDEHGNQIYDPNDPNVPLVDSDAIDKALSDYAEIQTKNYAYDMASSIMSVMQGSGGSGGSGSGTSGGGFLPLAGGSMSGRLSANYGVELGDSGKALITITHDGSNKPVGYFKLPMEITGNVSIDGELSLADTGIWFNKHQSIFIADQTLNIDYQNVKITGTTEIDGQITIGKILINGTNGITFDGHEYYHAGNCNNQNTDWVTKDLHVYGDLVVDGETEINGRFKALRGFDLGENGDRYLYSSYDNGKCHLWLATDLTIMGYENGIKFDDHYIIRTRTTANDVISFCAPGRVLNLGDTDTPGDPQFATKSVALQTNFTTADGLTTLITPSGKGFFRGLSATAVESGADVVKELVKGTVIATYSDSPTNKGVVFRNRATFYDPSSGPSLYSDDGVIFNVGLPYIQNINGVPNTTKYLWTTKLVVTDSPYGNPTLSSPTLALGTDAQFFRFDKPVEAEFFSIKLGKHQTKLGDGVLFLDNNDKIGGNNLFLEAVGNSIFHSGNATFNHSLSSQVFTSGMAGSGWAILENALNGSFHATFDELTVRKKMRIYELEVQKQNVTNGSWWVTDSCSGDLVEEVL